MKIQKLESFTTGAILTDTAIKIFVDEYKQFKASIKLLSDFYKNRNYSYIWLSEHGISPRVNMFANLLHDDFFQEKFNSDTVYKKFLSIQKSNATDKKEKLKNLELELTGVFFHYATKEWKGSDSSLMKKASWFIPSKIVNFEAILDSLITDKPGSFKSPVYRQYDLLKKHLAEYRQIQQNGGWPMVYLDSLAYKLGDTSSSISLYKKRLSITHDYLAEDTSVVFDSNLVVAIKKFQARHGMTISGIIDEKLAMELNTTVDQRIEQLIVNIERCKWVPVKQMGRYIVVNLPEYKLHVYDGDSLLWTMNVVIGKATNKTVIFNGNLKYIVLNPYWNVPMSIIGNELLPKLKKNAQYLASQQMEILKTNKPSVILDAATIDWNQPANKFNSYTIRQKPGTHNALGKIKFLFPNEYNIYLHDTPSKSLFERTNRSFSHGCIRLSDPQKLALFLLETEHKWTAKNLEKALKTEKEQYLVLKKAIPVFIAYFTSWVDRDGNLNFRDDIYNHDAVMAKLLLQPTNM